MNKIKVSLVLIATIMLSISQDALAKVNPFNQAFLLTTKYMPAAVVKMWETEHLTWRAQLLHAGCTNDFKAINQEINASFSLVHDYILDQAILNGELSDEDVKFALQDVAKLHYKIYSSAYRYGYVYRLKVLQKFHPDINPGLCDDAKKMSAQYFADETPILPWQHTGSLRNEKWRANIFAMRIMNKRFFPAYLARQRQFGYIIDAQIYALMKNDIKAYGLFTEVTGSYAFQNLLLDEIAKSYELKKNKKLQNSPWLAIYTKKAADWATQAYVQSTISALKRVDEKQPQLYQNIKRHMDSFVDLQLSRLEADKERIKQRLELN
jgi:hypothetical protein